MVKSLLEKQQSHFEHFFKNIETAAVEKILQKLLICSGSVILSGVGKSGHIAQKIAMTLLSTGTRAFFLSPTEALHGDIGLVRKQDVVLLFSKSGETGELLALLPYLKSRGAHVIGVVSNQASKLARLADDFIHLPLKAELCPFNMAPTTSAALQLIFGDLLSVALMQAKGFSLEQYSRNHPAGNIGLKTKLRVEDLMLSGKDIPLCSKEDILIDVLPVLSSKQCGALLVVDTDMRLEGIFTDGDLRRSIERHGISFSQKKIKEVMTNSPKWTTKKVLALEALEAMEEDPSRLIMVLPVLDGQKVVGLLKLHQLVQAGLRG